MMVADPPLPGHAPGPEYVAGKNNIAVLGFYRGEAEQVQRSLPFLFPPVLYLWGKKSNVGMPDYATKQVKRTCVGLGGGVGVASGQVKSLYMENVGHNIVLEKPKEAAVFVGDWMRKQHLAWKKEAKAREHQAPFKPGIMNPLWYEKSRRSSINGCYSSSACWYKLQCLARFPWRSRRESLWRCWRWDLCGEPFRDTIFAWSFT